MEELDTERQEDHVLRFTWNDITLKDINIGGVLAW